MDAAGASLLIGPFVRGCCVAGVCSGTEYVCVLRLEVMNACCGAHMLHVTVMRFKPSQTDILVDNPKAPGWLLLHLPWEAGCAVSFCFQPTSRSRSALLCRLHQRETTASVCQPYNQVSQGRSTAAAGKDSTQQQAHHPPRHSSRPTSPWLPGKT